MRFSLALFLALCLAGCGLLPDKIDETKDWSASKLYSEAKSSLSDGNYDTAIKYFEKLEARFPYGRFAQQAQLEIAYAYYKQKEPASAIAACDRFIKLHPNHPNVDYAYYLKALANFNDDLGLLGSWSGQDMTERDPKAARDAFDAFKDMATRFPNSK
jgi:outer membrane protein assembly factor BamD